MFINEKLKLNKFIDVQLPKNSDYFSRLSGIKPSVPSSQFSGDDFIPEGRKIDMMAYAENVNDSQIREESDE